MIVVSIFIYLYSYISSDLPSSLGTCRLPLTSLYTRFTAVTLFALACFKIIITVAAAFIRPNPTRRQLFGVPVRGFLIPCSIIPFRLVVFELLLLIVLTGVHCHLLHHGRLMTSEKPNLINLQINRLRVPLDNYLLLLVFAAPCLLVTLINWNFVELGL